MVHGEDEESPHYFGDDFCKALVQKIANSARVKHVLQWERKSDRCRLLPFSSLSIYYYLMGEFLPALFIISALFPLILIDPKPKQENDDLHEMMTIGGSFLRHRTDALHHGM